YVWTHGRHQYGPWGTVDDRRLCDLLDAAAISSLCPGLDRLVRDRSASDGLPDHGGRWHGAGTQRYSVVVWPPPRNAAGHLGNQPDTDAGRTNPLRRAERRSQQPFLDVRRRDNARRPGT